MFHRLRHSLNLLIYAPLNNHGLAFNEDHAEDRLLRYRPSPYGPLNYNGFWGVQHPKAPEISLVERDILYLQQRLTYRIGVTIHQDSTRPQQGLAYANNTPKKAIEQIRDEFTHQWGTPLNLIVDELDDGTTAEEWMAYSLGLPALCIETPFRAGLATVELPFAHAVINAIASATDTSLYPPQTSRLLPPPPLSTTPAALGPNGTYS